MGVVSSGCGHDLRWDHHGSLRTWSRPAKEEAVVDVEGKVKEILLEILDIREEDITPKASFTDDLKATSIDLVEIVAALQNTFDVNIDEAEVARLRTVQDAVACLKSAIAQKGTGAS
jgi:acyl carrier protein